jgi:PAS domain S-box-containing protein
MDRSEMFEEMVETVGVGVGIYGADGRYRYVNRAYADLLGCDRESLVGTPIWEVVPEFDRDRFEDYWDSFEGGETRTTQTVHEFEGTAVPVSVVTTRKTIQGATYHFGTIRDITDLRERERELEAQNERLEAFTGVVSHDLRNPLSVANGYVEILNEDIDRDELELVDSALDRMSILIDDLLRLAREGRAIDNPAPVSLTDVAAAARNTVDSGEGTITIEDDIRFMADESRFQQLLENLMRNAVEHGSTSPDSEARRDAVEHGGGDVTVTVGALPDEPGFYVEDDGPGIPPEDRETVFYPATSDSGPGLGLGLAIVKEVVDAHGWDVAVTESADGGARFEVTGVRTEA